MAHIKRLQLLMMVLVVCLSMTSVLALASDEPDVLDTGEDAMEPVEEASREIVSFTEESENPSEMVATDGVNSGTWGNLTWILDDAGTLTIDGSGDMADCQNITEYPWGSIRDTIREIHICFGVTNIGNNAFYNCGNLTAVDIPQSVRSIGNRAFYRCESLTSVSIPKGVICIGKEAFSGCINLISLEVASSVEEIGDYAFYNCYRLVSVEISTGVTNIGNYAFCNCQKLEEITIPSGLTVIGNNAFSCCNSLEDVYIPGSVCSIGKASFSGSRLSAINVAPENECYTSDDGVLFNKSRTEIVSYPSGKTYTHYTIPVGVTSIGDHAFEFCKNLISLDIPSSVTHIGDSSFADCYGLMAVTIPEGVEQIGYMAFWKCSYLTTVTIPTSLKNIGEYAFANCGYLSTIYYAGTQTQWNLIHISSDNGALTGAVLICSHVHNYIENTIKEPTCTERGYTVYTCAYGEKLTDDYIAPLGHIHGENDSGVVTAPTCTEQGYTTYTCTRCKQTYRDDFTDALSPDTGHTPTIDKAVAATCTAAGHTAGSHCSICGVIIVAPETIPATGHDYDSNDICTKCNCRKPKDLDGDGILGASDLIVAMKYIAGQRTDVNLAADINNNGEVDLLDLVRLMKEIAKVV